ncbi:class I SAM-dependent methyltransferase [Yamadazyma tenuis]|uniref:25S rRNA (uridine-N(3))-methyltransferase BMT5-like domain-containing protein n=1 Tax=Candida tenuis (strain ATCC 10573 / BCRC 21748 / CBS 615 / JCM 9827 / NBRC 10315 / NRRL Y-1498 / VKM Y-70) TaxID=590646 RepID=G3BBX5_CANTC|nr:uncharacterized protein CANTEDRAFT_111886 [Yamadazyma tenuis ATCC 10573]EGV60105.1 hypothetical protein CANTEDRAFT_111886 [Yamadazyma tenuis ATCC 10573]WEJ94661.1 class I SAM-dependent methyltransferase [Yamadazyma tenuis]
MVRKLKGKVLAKKGLKGALVRHHLAEVENKKRQETLNGTAEQQKLKQNSIKQGKSKNKHKQQAHQKQKGLIPFNPEEKVLLIGEGDFSFAVSIIKQNHIKPQNLIATSLDSLEQLKAKYSDVDGNLEFLSSEGVRVVHEVDGTNLMASFKLDTKKGRANSIFKHSRLHHIMFNFPHTGRGMKDVDRNIKDHQELMLKYFQSCKQLFQFINDESNSSFGGYNFDSVTGRIVLTLFEGEPYNSWGVKVLAKSENYKVEKSGRFDWGCFPEYHHKRTSSGVRDTTKPAAERDARIYVFEPFVKLGKAVKEDSDSD